MAKKAFDKVTTNALIIGGFADGINALNKEVIDGHEHMRPLVDGRGYAKPWFRVNPPNIHTGAIHAFSFAEMPPTPILDVLEKSSDYYGALYMGVAGLLNLSFMAAMRPGAAILFDINPVQRVFWKHALDLLRHEKTGADFMDALVKRTPRIHKEAAKYHKDAKHLFFGGGALKAEASIEQFMMLTYMGSPLHQWQMYRKTPMFRWVDDVRGYNHLRAMAQENAVGTLTLDAQDKKGWEQLIQHLDTLPHGHPNRASVLYLSNMLTFMCMGGDDIMFRNDPQINPVRAKDMIAPIMVNPNHGVITETANPRMTWPENLDYIEPIPPGLR